MASDTLIAHNKIDGIHTKCLNSWYLWAGLNIPRAGNCKGPLYAPKRISVLPRASVLIYIYQQKFFLIIASTLKINTGTF